MAGAAWIAEQEIYSAAANLFASCLALGAPSLRVRSQGGLKWWPWGQPLGLSHRPPSRPAAHTSARLSPVAEVLSECRLLAYISQVPTQMSFLFRLINIIHVQTLTQVRGPADVRWEESLSRSLTEPFPPAFSLGVRLPETHLPVPPGSSRTFSSEGSVPRVTDGT